MSERPRKGKYELIRRLARGGMAEIYLARESRLIGPPRVVALKRILPHLCKDESFLLMFLSEARIAAQLNHPNIIQIYDLGRAGESYFIAMEYVNGLDLEAIQGLMARSGNRIPVGIAAYAMSQVCSGLHYAHTKTEGGRPLNVVHRDLTPGNVVVGFQGAVKIVDFGVAKAEAQLELTNPGVVKGKLRYLSPEQIANEPVDPRTDIWAMGITLYEVTTGVKAFAGGDTITILQSIRDKDPPPPMSLIHGYPPHLSGIIMKALQKDRRRRHQSAAELGAELEAFATKEGTANRQQLVAFMREIAELQEPATVASDRAPPPVPSETVLDRKGRQSGASEERPFDPFEDQPTPDVERVGTVIDEDPEADGPTDRAPPVRVDRSSLAPPRVPADEAPPEPAPKPTEVPWAEAEDVSSLAVDGVEESWGDTVSIGIPSQRRPWRAAAVILAMLAAIVLAWANPEMTGRARDLVASGVSDVREQLSALSRSRGATPDVERTVEAPDVPPAPAASGAQKAPSPSAQAGGDSSPAPAQPTESPSEAPLHTPGRGKLAVDSNPWGYVFLDDGKARRKLGMTPLEEELPPGAYNLVVENPSGTSAQKRIRLRAGAILRLKMSLEPEQPKSRLDAVEVAKETGNSAGEPADSQPPEASPP